MQHVDARARDDAFPEDIVRDTVCPGENRDERKRSRSSESRCSDEVVATLPMVPGDPIKSLWGELEMQAFRRTHRFEADFLVAFEGFNEMRFSGTPTNVARRYGTTCVRLVLDSPPHECTYSRLTQNFREAMRRKEDAECDERGRLRTYALWIPFEAIRDGHVSVFDAGDAARHRPRIVYVILRGILLFSTQV